MKERIEILLAHLKPTMGNVNMTIGLERMWAWFGDNRLVISKWAGGSIAVFLIVYGLYTYPSLVRRWSIAWEVSRRPEVTLQDPEILSAKLQKDIMALDKKLATKIPKNHYMVINTASNEFSLYKGGELVRKDKCSTGSYVLLKRGDKEKWMFKTPKGEFKIRGKTTAPVWKKPDWAFVEEGLPVPSYNHPSRFEYGVLGDYSLSLGDGYLIHGTLYQRFLGLPVTHGCIRLNDDNLKLVYQTMNNGSKVYIY